MPNAPAELAVADIVWSLESGQEIAVNRLWLSHVHFTGQTFSWGDALQTIADHVVSSISSPPSGSSPLQYIQSATKLTRVDAYSIGTDWKATDKRTHDATADNVSGTMTGQALPPIFSPVLHLTAFTGYVSNARRRTGRLFLPAPSDSALGTDGLLTSTFRNNVANAWTNSLNDIQGMHVSGGDGSASDYMSVVVVSRLDGLAHQLESVKVNNKPGIVKSRMNKLIESYGDVGVISHQ